MRKLQPPSPRIAGRDPIRSAWHCNIAAMVVQSAENVDILAKVAIPFDAQIGYQCPGDCAFTDSSRSIASVT
jgi:hypothetical protein